MPLALKVEVDERSLDAAGNKIASEFDNIGGRVAQDFVKNFGSGVSSALPNALSGVTKGVFDGIGAGAKEAFGGISGGAVAAGLAVAGLGTAAVLVGKQLYEIGAAFDAVGDKIAARTNAIGADMDRLNASLSSVFTQTASSLSEVGDILGRVSQSLHLTGQPLEDLTKQIADLNRMTGESVNIREFGKVFAAFGTDASQASKVLDQLYVATAKTGAPLNELLDNLINAGPAARTLGLNLDDTAGLFVKFEEGGLNASRAQQALNNAAKVFADSNIDLKTGLADTITQIRGFIDAGNEAGAVDLAGKVFGTRGAQQFVDLIRQGKLGADDLHGSLNTAGDDIEKLNDRTKDWAETWTLIKNRITDAAAQVGGPLFNALNSVAQAGLNPNNPGADQGMVGLNKGSDIWNWIFPTGGPPPAVRPGDQYGPAPSSPSGSREPGYGPSQLQTPQDINQAIEDAKKKPGDAGGGPVVPFGPMPQLQPGESAAQYNAEVSVAEARNELEQKKATLNAIEGDNTKTADEIQKAKNDVIAAETRNTQAQLRLNEVGTGGSAGTAQVPYGPGYGAPPRPGETTAVYNAEQGIIEAQHSTLQARAQLQRVEADSKHTADELIKARNDLAKAEGDEIQAQMRLSDAIKTSSGTLEEFGNKLDADLGLSEGLPGLADNLFRFLGNLAAAPILGPLQAMSAAQGGIDKTGSGLIGMIASQMGGGGGGGGGGLASILGGRGGGGGVADLLGPGGPAAGGGARVPYGLPAGSNSGGYGGGGAQFPDWVNQMAESFGIKPSTYPGHQESNRNEPGFAPNPEGLNRAIDWSGPTENLQKFADYLKTIPQDLEQVIWQNPNTGQRTGVAGGQDVSQSGYYGGDYGGHTDHVHTRQSESIPLPGGGGGAPGGPGGAPAGANWDAMAQGESSGNWQTNTGNGYFGGLQFKQSSWEAAGGMQYAPRADLASPDQQKSVADTLLGMQGPGAWPNTFVPGAAAGGGIPIIAHAGEHMLTANDVSAMGGQVGVYNFRNALHLAGGGPPESPQLPPPPPPPPVQHMPTSSGRGSGPAPGPQPMASGQGGGPAPGPSAVGGVEKPSTPGGGISGGGLAGAATGAAAMAADMFAPGSGAAVQIASQEIQRAIKFGGQVAAIGVNGLMETFLPLGASSLAQNNWISRIAGGFAGVQPQIPNLAGKSASVDEMNQKGAQPLQPSALPKPISSGQGSGREPGPQVVNVNVDNSRVHDIQSDVTHHQTQTDTITGQR